MTSAVAERFAHVNLNSRDLERTARFLTETLGLSAPLHFPRGQSDGTPMGLPGMVESEGMFVYDDRGPRRAPAVELIEWSDPRPTGPAPAGANRLGIASLGFMTRSVEDVRARITGSGASLVGDPTTSAAEAAGAPLLVTDQDGALFEFWPDPTAPVAGLWSRNVTVNCADMERSVAWYERLGFVADGPGERATYDGRVFGLDADVELTSVTLRLPTNHSYALRLVQWHSPAVLPAADESLSRTGYTRVCVTVSDPEALQDMWQELRAHGTECAPPHLYVMPEWETSAIFPRDPDGACLEVATRPLDLFVPDVAPDDGGPKPADRE